MFSRFVVTLVYVLKNISSSYDGERDFDVILGSVVSFRKLSWICRREHSNMSPDKLKYQVSQQFCCATRTTFMSRQGYITLLL